MTAIAAYCQSCRTHVLVSHSGDCIHGHPRSSLRGLYTANLDKRTGSPLPPSAESRRASLAYPTPPVAPVADAALFAPGVPASAVRLAPTAVPGPAISGTKSLVERILGPMRGNHSASSFALFGSSPKGKHSLGARR
jgi:hypothetical protein